MALTLSSVLVSGLTRIGQMAIGKATGGSTTTLVNSNVDPDNVPEDDAYKNGFAVVIRDAGGASAAPEGEFNRISAFTASSGTWTVDTAFTTAVASGDIFGYTNPQFDLQTMIRLVNESLKQLGDLPLVDTTTLDTASAQTEYAASVGWKRAKPYRIDIQGKTGDSNDNRWVQVFNWDWVPAAGGSTGLIIFENQPITSRDIRVWYRDVHPQVNASSDVINERIDPELMTQAFIFQVRNWQVEQDDGSDENLKEKWNKAKQELAEILVNRPIEKPKRASRLLIVGADIGDRHLPYPRVP